MKNYEQMIKDAEWLSKDSRERLTNSKKSSEREYQNQRTASKRQRARESSRRHPKRTRHFGQDNRTDQNQIAILDQEVGQMTRDVADMKREKTILELMAKQQDFWGALEMRGKK